MIHLSNYIVYKHTNKINKKVYIGITSQTPENRWKNGNGYTSMYFERAIKKYGWDGFEHEIICENLSKKDACNIERILIKSFRSYDPNYGYNKTLGGDGGGMFNKHHSEEAKRKISEARKRDGFTEEHKKHISESKSGVKHHLAKPVYQYTKDGKFVRKWDYMSQAAKELHLSKGNISNVCTGRVPSCGGFKWSYYYRSEIN